MGVEGALQRRQLEAVVALSEAGETGLPLADGDLGGPLHARHAELVAIAASHHFLG